MVNIWELLVVSLTFVDSQQTNMVTVWNFGDPSVPYRVRDAVTGYNNITDELFIFGGYNYDTGDQNIGYKYSYKTGIWSGIHFNTIITRNQAQYYTQHNNVIYYYSNKSIKTYNMTYPYSQELSIDASNITTYVYNLWSEILTFPCLSADINGNLFISSGGFVLDGNEMNYYGYNINDGIWKIFSHSSYWGNYNYDMRGMACIVHNQVLYTFGGAAGTETNIAEYYGSNMISYHDVSDYNKPFLLNGYSLWKKSAQDLKPFGGFWRAVSVDELIYIIGGWSYNTKTNGQCCIEAFNDVQIFDPRTHTIQGKTDGVAALPSQQWFATTCHYRSTIHTINCFGGQIGYTAASVSNNWIYSNVLVTESPSYSPTNIPSKLPTFLPTYTPTILPTIPPSIQPSNSPSHGPIIIPSNLSENAKSSPFNSTTIIIIGSMGFLICILMTVILYIIIYYKHKHSNTHVTTGNQIMMSSKTVTSTSLSQNAASNEDTKLSPKPDIQDTHAMDDIFDEPINQNVINIRKNTTNEGKSIQDITSIHSNNHFDNEYN